MTEEEVAMEMEAVEAVYGDEAVIVDSYPPHLHLHIKPRTAEISSQQFVEAVVRIQAGPKYPDEPPEISLIESKGLDEERQKLLMGFVQEKSLELSSSLMLVALCEEAVERLTIMNHPDGDCPLCLYPLFPEDGESDQMPFMKLMSCFHCFHCECIIRWWNWLHTEKEADSGSVDKSLGNCPVCRKVVHASDIEHVLGLVGATQSSQQLSCFMTKQDSGEVQDPVLQSESENMRRERFEAILKTQEEQGGLVQPKKNISVVPGMYLPPPPAPASSSSNQEEAQEQGQQVEQYKDAESETNSSSSNNRRGRGRGRGGRGHSNVNRRKQNPQDPRKPTKQWVQRS
ncbi:E3 ubiquitin-protein ligase RNF25 isoform X2 [Brassica rapa]|uniref:E3 ubiquitin-protein ligase RNF25 isoform X2 n=1 Tax=Brassica campestris TaxID=3711 RepID=UPI00142D2BA0|nr:E3 ubiquitin-protein ligase RNF25 isoform X2 [Brassica rapa]